MTSLSGSMESPALAAQERLVRQVARATAGFTASLSLPVSATTPTSTSSEGVNPAHVAWMVAVLVFIVLLYYRVSEANRLGIYLPDQDRWSLLCDLGQVLAWSYAAMKVTDKAIRRKD